MILYIEDNTLAQVDMDFQVDILRISAANK